MVTGTIKSGKTLIVADVLPRLLSQQYSEAPAASRRRPVIFYHAFTLGAPAAAAAERWLSRLLAFARGLGIPLARPEGAAADCLPDVAQALAERVYEEGGQLWLLFDELGAPVVASSASEARAFMQLFKDTLTATSAKARTVATGSGMVSLLKAMADAAVNGYTLWGSATHVCVGHEFRPPLALSIAQRLHSVYAPSWPPAVRAHVTPQRLLDSLAFGAHAGLTSPRPALLAFLASRLRDANPGSPAEVLRWGLQDALFKLSTESRGDAAVGLERMLPAERKALRELAVHGILPAHYPLSGFANVLCEDDWAAVAAATLPPQTLQRRLLPPYGQLLGSWIRPDGWLSISSDSARLPLVPRVLQTLLSLPTCCRRSLRMALAWRCREPAPVRRPLWQSLWACPQSFLCSLRWTLLLQQRPARGRPSRPRPSSLERRLLLVQRHRPSSWRTRACLCCYCCATFACTYPLKMQGGRRMA